MRARETWAASTLPAVIVPNAVGAAIATDLRARFDAAGYTRCGLIDRASYDLLERPDAPEILEALTGIASEVTGRPLTLVDARVLRFRAGDYALVRHDRVHDDRPVELVLDLSAAVVPGADVHFRHRGQVFFVVPSAPGSLAIVERGPTVMCNHTYLTKRNPNPVVVRLMVLLASAAMGDAGPATEAAARGAEGGVGGRRAASRRDETRGRGRKPLGLGRSGSVRGAFAPIGLGGRNDAATDVPMVRGRDCC